jgi:hypothetical protein
MPGRIQGTAYILSDNNSNFSVNQAIMARIARVIAEGMPHHITQPGNRRQQTFFAEDDYKAYLKLMAEWCGKYHVGKQPEEWPWSSASAHIKVKNDILVNVSPAFNYSR